VILNPSDAVVGDRSASIPSALAQSDLASPQSHSSSVLEYLLVCEATSESLTRGTWQFTLEQSDGTPVFLADDTDAGDLNRLTLLAAVRGLESIEGPSSVTLLSNNRYLIRSLSDSLPRWRENNFVWEHFGRRIDVQHADLWRRIDRALSIHRVEAVLISSRLVSRGIGNVDCDGLSPQLRADAPHLGVRAPKTLRSADSDHRSQRQDRLRQWLIGNTITEPTSTARNRFPAIDLIEST